LIPIIFFTILYSYFFKKFNYRKFDKWVLI
jgi:hypothetical protein